MTLMNIIWRKTNEFISCRTIKDPGDPLMLHSLVSGVPVSDLEF